MTVKYITYNHFIVNSCLIAELNEKYINNTETTALMTTK